VADFPVVSVELQVCGSMLARLGEEVGARLESAGAEVDALLAAGWAGRAADRFAEGWQRWQAGAREVVAGLDAMGRSLGETGRDYTAAERQAVGTIEEPGPGPR
jgi:WXG100 family type VII secretion target